MKFKYAVIAFMLLTLSLSTKAQPETEMIKLLANDGQSDDMFGNSLSISGDIAVIGTPQDDDEDNNTGAVYIFERVDANWNFIQKIIADDGELADMFGISVDIAGDYIVVGSYQAVGVTGNTGAAYIFWNNGTSWEQQAKVFANDGESADNLGKSIAISGDYMVAGADNKDFGTGAAYVFHRENTTWSQVAKLIEPDGEMNDYFAHSVDISGDYIVAGAWQNNAVGSNSGAVYVFKNNSSVWEYDNKLTAEDAVVDDGFGYSVSVSGNYIIAGAHGDDGSKGSAYIFYNNSGEWTQQAKIISDDGNSEDFFGKSVSISGDYAIVGAQRNDASKSEEGAAYLYVRNGNYWSQQEKFTASDANDTGLFGYCVTIENDFALVSTVQDNGAVYVFGPENVGNFDNENSGISVYPNPVKNILNIQNAENCTIQIIDICGRVMNDFIVNKQQYQIEISNYKSGVYFVKINQTENIIIKKIMVR